MKGAAPGLEERRRLYEIATSTPGLSGPELERRSELDPGVVAAQLRELVGAGHLLRARGLRQDYYFATAIAPGGIRLAALGRSPSARKVALVTLEMPAIDAPELAGLLGWRTPVVAAHLGPLCSMGVVGRHISEGRALHAIADRRRLGQMMATPESRFAGGWIDRYTEVWEDLFPGG